MTRFKLPIMLYALSTVALLAPRQEKPSSKPSMSSAAPRRISLKDALPRRSLKNFAYTPQGTHTPTLDNKDFLCVGKNSGSIIINAPAHQAGHVLLKCTTCNTYNHKNSCGYTPTQEYLAAHQQLAARPRMKPAPKGVFDLDEAAQKKSESLPTESRLPKVLPVATPGELVRTTSETISQVSTDPTAGRALATPKQPAKRALTVQPPEETLPHHAHTRSCIASLWALLMACCKKIPA